MDKIYTVTVSRFEWADIIDQKPFSSIQKAIEYANMYGSYKDENKHRCFDYNEFDETNWQKIKKITASDNITGRITDYTLSIDEIPFDDFNGLENG